MGVSCISNLFNDITRKVEEVKMLNVRVFFRKDFSNLYNKFIPYLLRARYFICNNVKRGVRRISYMVELHVITTSKQFKSSRD